MERASYIEKVYAGVLGKIIGVYLGRPVEGWTHERIVSELGEVSTYVNDRLGLPLVVTDDDISGTFTFVRALEDSGDSPALTPEAVGQAWLNYIVEGRTILWWGGRGTSTEHTAYLNLKAGLGAPASGSAAVNGRTVANQIGAMIFIDGWAMLSPGDPERAARLARTAASVSHDADALDAAAIIAGLEALAFVEADISRLLDEALRLIPPGGAVAAQVQVVRELHARQSSWSVARDWLDLHHGYHWYPGTCHVMPNFSLILLGLLYGGGDFRESLRIVTTAGWDTDCNAANLGCLLGIRNGLAAVERCADLRRPHRDLMYLSSADGGRAVTDAAREAVSLANTHFRMHGQPEVRWKGGARLPFVLPGAVHGFAPATPGLELESGVSPSGERGLRLRLSGDGAAARAATPVLIRPAPGRQGSYDLQQCPSLHPGQLLRARVAASPGNGAPVSSALYVAACGDGDAPRLHRAPPVELAPGCAAELAWRVEVGSDSPVLEVGLELRGPAGARPELWLEWMDWAGCPEASLGRPAAGAQVWKSAWVDAVDAWATQFGDAFHLSQNRGVGLVIQGAREWRDYTATAAVGMVGLRRGGLAVRVQGLRRYYALLLERDGVVRLVKERHGEQVLAEAALPLEENRRYALRLTVRGSRLQAWIDERALFDCVDAQAPLEGGAVGLVLEDGTLVCDSVAVRGVEAS